MGLSGETTVNLANYIRDIPDFPKPGILFKDITPLLANPEAFQAAVEAMYRHYQTQPPDAVSAAEALDALEWADTDSGATLEQRARTVRTADTSARDR